MTIDKIEWHLDDVVTNGSEEDSIEKAGVHIGYFMEWAYKNGFAPDNPETHDVAEYKKVTDSEINGLQFLVENCDSKFWDVDLNERGQKFAFFAYDSYLDNYSSIVKHDPYTKKYNLEDRQRVFSYLDEVYANYLKIPLKEEKKSFLNKIFKKDSK